MPTDPCDLYALEIETITVVIPGAVYVSEDCDVPEVECCNSDTIAALICEDETLSDYDGDYCDSAWESDSTTGLGQSIQLEVEQVTVRLPAGAEITGTACYTIGCDDTIDLDCECA